MVKREKMKLTLAKNSRDREFLLTSAPSTVQYSPVQPCTAQYSPVQPSTPQYSQVHSTTAHHHQYRWKYTSKDTSLHCPDSLLHRNTLVLCFSISSLSKLLFEGATGPLLNSLIVYDRVSCNVHFWLFLIFCLVQNYWYIKKFRGVVGQGLGRP